jgi:hypothetical protein
MIGVWFLSFIFGLIQHGLPGVTGIESRLTLANVPVLTCRCDPGIADRAKNEG